MPVVSIIYIDLFQFQEQSAREREKENGNVCKNTLHKYRQRLEQISMNMYSKEKTNERFHGDERSFDGG